MRSVGLRRRPGFSCWWAANKRSRNLWLIYKTSLSLNPLPSLKALWLAEMPSDWLKCPLIGQQLIIVSKPSHRLKHSQLPSQLLSLFPLHMHQHNKSFNILMNYSKSLKESFIYNFISWTSMFRITCINDFPILWKRFSSYMTYWSFSLDAIHYGKWVIPSNKKMNITSTKLWLWK